MYSAVKRGALSDVRIEEEGEGEGAIHGDSWGRWGASFGETQGRCWRELLVITGLCRMNAAFHGGKCCVAFTRLTESAAEFYLPSQSELRTPLRAPSVSLSRSSRRKLLRPPRRSYRSNMAALMRAFIPPHF